MLPPEITLPDEVAAADLVADRRGSRIWRITLADSRKFALKYATDHGGHEYARFLAAREATVLRRLGKPGYLYAAGSTAGGSWVAVRWIDAPTIAERWQALHSNPREARTAAAVSAWVASNEILALHRSGWRHADLQAAHVLVPDNGPAHLIDHAWSQGPPDVAIAPAVTYRGALAHLTAPEIALAILDTPADRHIELTERAETYTWGAILFAAWTGHWPCDYATDPLSLTPEQIHRFITDPSTRRRAPDDWPPMAGLIDSMLDHDPRNRPAMTEVQADLTAQVGNFSHSGPDARLLR